MLGYASSNSLTGISKGHIFQLSRRTKLTGKTCINISPVFKLLLPMRIRSGKLLKMKQLCNSKMSLVQVNTDNKEIDRRVFNYSLNKKKTKSKLLKGAKRSNNLEIEIKDGCVNLRFCDGSYFEIVLPLIKLWSKKVDETIKIDDTEVHVAEVDAGLEKSDNHVDTKMIIITNGDRIVLHAYNSTQNLMVQGKNYENFAVNCLQPFFVQKIKQSIDKIRKFNSDVKESLGPKNSTKIRSDKPYNCQHCEVKPSTIGDLRLHMKKCHTKPTINSPANRKAIKFVNDKVIPMNVEEKELDNKKIEDQIPDHISALDVEDLVSCEKFEYDANNKHELDEHIEVIHSQNVTVTEDSAQIKSIVNTDLCNTEAETDNAKENPSICGECGKGFEDMHQCTLHMAVHE